MFSENFKIGSGYILICLIWGSTWLAIRIGLDSLTPIAAGGFRFTLASLFVYTLMRLRKIKLQTDPLSIKLYLVMAFFSFAIPFGMVYWAEQFIPSGLASILFAVFPFFVILFSRIAIPENKTSAEQITGAAIGFAGIVTIFSEGLTLNLSDYMLGMLAVFFSAVIQAGMAVTIKKYGHHLNPLSMNFVPLLIGGIVMIITALFVEDKNKWVFDEKAILSVIYLAFFGTVVTFTTYYWLLKRMSIVILSLITLITPITAVVLGWLIMNEKFSGRDLIGSGMVLIGILFANFRGLLNYYHQKKINQ